MTKKMYKSVSVAAGAIVLMATQTQANMTGNSLKSAPYIGAAVGLSHMSGDMKFTNANVPNNFAVNSFTLPQNLSGNSIDGSIFFGYGHKFGCYWLAGELGYTFDGLKSQSKTYLQTLTNTKDFITKSNGALEAAIHVGWVPYPSIALYAILGVENRRFKVSFQDNVTPVPDIAPTINKSYTSTAFAPGIGALIKITKNLAVKGEYKAALHRSKTFTASKANAAAVGTDNITMKVSPIIHTVKVGLVFNF